MSLRVTFELDDDDLKHFKMIMQEARKAAAGIKPEDIVEAAERLLKGVDVATVPHFIGQRLQGLRDMIDMLQDHEWRLPADDAKRVLNALAYFCEPEDLIPDHVPGLGFLDDAIMIELAVRELRHEIEAYRDFCDYRGRAETRRGVKAKTSDVTREDWLAERRRQLQSRMHRRRKRSLSRAAGGALSKLF